MPVMSVAGVAAMSSSTLNALVLAITPMDVAVIKVHTVLRGAHRTSLLCRTASATMWPTRWSAREYTASLP